MADQIGEIDIRGENITKAVKGFSAKQFKLRQVCKVISSSNYTETYYEETNTILTAGGNRNINQVARGSLPPEVHPDWTEHSAVQRKMMAQETIFYEDIKTNAIATQARTLFRVSEAVANAEDIYIYAELTGATSTSGVVAAADDWNSATEANRDPIGDILIGIAAIGANNYDFRANGYIIMDELDYSSLLRNSKVINNPSFKTADVVSNGVVGEICSGKIIVTETVSTDEVMLVVGQRAATLLIVDDLQTFAKPDPGINVKVRAWEMLQLQITDPQGLYTITGTQV